jgi:hypothetical protein
VEIRSCGISTYSRKLNILQEALSRLDIINLAIQYNHNRILPSSPSTVHLYVVQTIADIDFSSFDTSDANGFMNTYYPESGPA